VGTIYQSVLYNSIRAPNNFLLQRVFTPDFEIKEHFMLQPKKTNQKTKKNQTNKKKKKT
jgi:hypothetical protein